MLGRKTNLELRRLDPYNHLQEVLGTDPATTLMNHLPPVTAADLLTKIEFTDLKKDSADFRREIGERFDHVNKRIDRVLIVVAAFVGTAVL